MAERDLAAVARQNVQPDDRDEVDADGRKLERAEVADPARRERDERGDREEAEQAEGATRRHTFLTAARPKSPEGRTTSTSRITASATGRRRVPPTKPT